MSELTKTHSRPGSHRVPALDGIRGFAIVWVILHNATEFPAAPAEGLFRLMNALVHPGWIGVQLFFALSGFLITYGLLETQDSLGYFRNFYAKRALRILPLYYGVLFALLVVAPRVSSLRWPAEGQASLWLFTMNWTHEAPLGFGHFWSLAVEEQFYLVWPFVVWRLSPRRLLCVCLGISSAALALRCFLFAVGTDPLTIYTNTVCRMDALAFGSSVACVLRVKEWREWAAIRIRSITFVAVLLFLLGIPAADFFGRQTAVGATLGYTFLSVSSAAVVLSVVLPGPTGSVKSALSWGPLRSFGRYSYAMYVFHGIAHKLIGEPWLRSRFGTPSTQQLFFYALLLVVASYAMGFCSYHLLEKRFLTLKRSFGSSLSGEG